MKLRCVLIGLILFATPAFAGDQSPWFGSEATEATQVSLISQAESTIVPDEEASLYVSEPCANEGCPATANLAK
jgi:hypothetical protein